MATRRGNNYPIEIGSSALKRVQDFNVDMDKGGQSYGEMGNFGSVGTEFDNPQYTGSLNWNPIDNQIEEALAGKEANAEVTLKDLMTVASPPAIKGPTTGLNAVKVSGLNYSCQVGGEFQGSADLRGTGWNDGDSTITPPTIAGVPVFKSKSVAVVLGTTRAVRCAGFTARVNIPTEDDYEMTNEDPFDTSQDVPEITAEIQWWESDVKAGNVEPTIAAPVDIIIGVGGTAKKITLKNMVFTGKGAKGQVKGKVTLTYKYRCNGDDTTYGLSITADNTAPTPGTISPSPASPQAAGTSITITLAGASDANGIFKVDFYDGTTKIGTDTSAPYTCTWSASGVGAHSLTAKIEDIYGAVATTPAVSFTVS